MRLILKTILAFLFLINFNYILLAHQPKKIIGLMQVRNEENIIEQHLRALTYYTDALVILDDASDDMTPSILTRYADEFKIEKIITNKVSSRESGNESDNSQLLLDTGRSIGGTHFIIIDADEMFTAHCLDNNFLKNTILSLNPGDSIEIQFINLWRSTKQYRYDELSWVNPILKCTFLKCIFCDDKQCSYQKKWLHAVRIPANLTGTTHRIDGCTYNLLHFQFTNWQNLLTKQAWYRCLERVKNPKKSISEINQVYEWSKNESKIQLKKCPDIWFKSYSFFDPSVYDIPETWRKKQVHQWFCQYGKEYFKDLDIWDIDWYN